MPIKITNYKENNNGKTGTTTKFETKLIQLSQVQCLLPQTCPSKEKLTGYMYKKAIECAPALTVRIEVHDVVKGHQSKTKSELCLNEVRC